MGDSGFFHDDPCFFEAFLQFEGQCLRYFIHAAAEGDRVGVLVIVGIAAGKVPQGRFILYPDVVLVVIDIKLRLSGVLHPPNHNGRDFYRVAVFVIHLEPLPVQVAGA